jgi:transposase
MADTSLEVILGVDTHSDTHTAVVIDQVGRVQGTLEIPATPAGHRHLLAWVRELGVLRRAGVEGTGAYGAGLCAALDAEGIEVLEVDRPNRQRRRKHGKSDPTDAEAAARAVLAGDATSIPKTKGGIVESIRVLRVARSGAIKARTQAANQLTALVLTSPDELRSELRPLTTKGQVARAAAFRPSKGTDPHAATKRALRHVARRYQQLTAEIAELDADLEQLVTLAAPRTLARPGVGVDTAGQLLVTAGENINRIRSEAAFAALCGASPVPASSGKVTRHRLNRGGDRQANNALWRVAFIRMRIHEPTRTYTDHNRARGKTRKDTLRCLKRYIARELHPLLTADLRDAQTLALTK